MAQQLKQCPFCGYSAHKEYIRSWLLFGKKDFYIECNYCFASTDCYFSLDMAIENWNKRRMPLLGWSQDNDSDGPTT